MKIPQEGDMRLKLLLVALLSWISASSPALSEVTITEFDYEERAQFQVVTTNATYFFDRAGGGFSRVIDRDGKDWVAFCKAPLKEFPASAAAGYRGIPNLVYGAENPDAGAGHPGFDRCESEVVDGRTIRTRSKSKQWEWEWTFTDNDATLTILKVDELHPFWFLYEGPVGGKWSPSTHFFGTDQKGPVRDRPTAKDQIVQPIRWAYFGDDSQSRVFLVLQRTEDTVVDNLWYLGDSSDGLESEDGMLVFGFGRERGSKPLLRGAGHQFRIAFVENVSIDDSRALHNTASGQAAAWIDSNDWPVVEVASKNGNAIQVTEETLFGDIECFRIATATATYLYGKRGAGFASILDPAGNDWISYRHGNQSEGEYRGLPKSGQPTKFFHCGYGFGQYKNDNAFTSKLDVIGPAHVRISSATADDQSACTWDFFPTHATMTLHRIANPAYWFLYEGTPGGKLDSDEDFIVRPGNRKTSLNEPWTENVPWVFFTAQESRSSFFLVDHQSDPGPESYVSWPYKPDANSRYHQMTVFGFGRPGWDDPKQHTPPLTALPARFSIGFAPTTEYPAVEATVKSILALPHPDPSN